MNSQDQMVSRSGIYNGTTPKEAKSTGDLPGTTFGARIEKGVVGTSDASVAVHWWYDVGTAVRYRVIYYLERPGGRISS